ncbi:hypothetical protein SBA3_2030009 [Candidatus Sulfopaludibacter sp. SbA3]|nr:hypothetical protein SBA3_2030009 [Candidatus Sulfopaludibacter sp. SbA3]
MDFTKVLEQLRAELANLDAAILSLERLQQLDAPRRGRPPKLPGGPKRVGRLEDRQEEAAGGRQE